MLAEGAFACVVAEAPGTFLAEVFPAALALVWPVPRADTPPAPCLLPGLCDVLDDCALGIGSTGCQLPLASLT